MHLRVANVLLLSLVVQIKHRQQEECFLIFLCRVMLDRFGQVAGFRPLAEAEHAPVI